MMKGDVYHRLTLGLIDGTVIQNDYKDGLIPERFINGLKNAMPSQGRFKAIHDEGYETFTFCVEHVSFASITKVMEGDPTVEPVGDGLKVYPSNDRVKTIYRGI